MPLRPLSPLLWFNLPGIMAAYQPIMAPSQVVASYNQARGGSSRYVLGSTALPTFSPLTGWTFDGSSQYLQDTTAPIIGVQEFTAIVSADVNVVQAPYMSLMGSRATGNTGWNFNAATYDSTNNVGGTFRGVADYPSSIACPTTPTTFSMVVTPATMTFYVGSNSEQVAVGTMSAPTLPGYVIGVGHRNNGLTTEWFSGSIKALALYRVALSDALVRNAALQMSYCDVNTDWSVWGVRRRWFYAATATGAVDLSVQDSVHAQAANTVNLTQTHVLTVNAARHAQSADTAALTQAQNLTVSSAAHAQAAGTATLDQTNILAVGDARHIQTADGVGLTQAHALSVMSAAHSQTADTVTLTGNAILSVSDASQTQAADTVTLTQTHILPLAGASHSHAAGDVTLFNGAGIDLVVDGSLHLQFAGIVGFEASKVVSAGESIVIQISAQASAIRTALADDAIIVRQWAGASER